MFADLLDNDKIDDNYDYDRLWNTNRLFTSNHGKYNWLLVSYVRYYLQHDSSYINKLLDDSIDADRKTIMETVLLSNTTIPANLRINYPETSNNIINHLISIGAYNKLQYMNIQNCVPNIIMLNEPCINTLLDNIQYTPKMESYILLSGLVNPIRKWLINNPDNMLNNSEAIKITCCILLTRDAETIKLVKILITIVENIRLWAVKRDLLQYFQLITIIDDCH
jgi:hypothetical protein